MISATGSGTMALTSGAITLEGHSPAFTIATNP
jgi:hypothetical protein